MQNTRKTVTVTSTMPCRSLPNASHNIHAYTHQAPSTNHQQSTQIIDMQNATYTAPTLNTMPTPLGSHTHANNFQQRIEVINTV